MDGHAAENSDPERAWRIIDDKLYFVYDPTYVGELDGPGGEKWLENADANWPVLKAELELSNGARITRPVKSEKLSNR